MAGKSQYTPEQIKEFRERNKKRMDLSSIDLAGKAVEAICSSRGEGPRRSRWLRGGISGVPQNALTGNPYTGDNLARLLIYASYQGYADPRYLTRNQALKIRNENGGSPELLQDETGLVLIRPVRIQIKDDPDAGSQGDDPLDQIENTVLVGFRPFEAFNAEQFSDFPAREPLKPRDWQHDDLIDRFVNASGAIIKHGGDKAYYAPGHDHIVMPYLDLFETAGDYYSSLLHEWYHWTAASGREDREVGDEFGDAKYAEEELRAEAFSYLAGIYLGLPFPKDVQSEYILSWNEKLERDPHAIWDSIVQSARTLETLMSFAQDEQPRVEWFPKREAWADDGVAVSASEVFAFDQGAPSFVPASDDFEPVEQASGYGVELPDEAEKGIGPVEMQRWLLESGHGEGFELVSQGPGVFQLITDCHGMPEINMPGLDDIQAASKLKDKALGQFPGSEAAVRTRGASVILEVDLRRTLTPSPAQPKSCEAKAPVA